MAYAPKPITLTQRSPVVGEETPQPFVVVGTIPGAGITPQVAPAAAVTFADLAAAVTYVNGMRTKLIASGVWT